MTFRLTGRIDALFNATDEEKQALTKYRTQVVLVYCARRAGNSVTIAQECESTNSDYQLGRECIGPPFRRPPNAHKGCIVKADEEKGYGRLKASEINHLLRMLPFILDTRPHSVYTHSTPSIIRCGVPDRPKMALRTAQVWALELITLSKRPAHAGW